MFKCKKHGITYFGKICKKCAKELEERDLYRCKNSHRCFTPQPAPDQIDASDIVLTSLLTNNISEHVRVEMIPEKIIDQPSFFEEGSSGGGGAERSFGEEPSNNSDCDSSDLESSSDSSDSSDDSDD